MSSTPAPQLSSLRSPAGVAGGYSFSTVTAVNRSETPSVAKPVARAITVTPNSASAPERCLSPSHAGDPHRVGGLARSGLAEDPRSSGGYRRLRYDRGRLRGP